MAAIAPRVRSFLEEHGVRYETIHHRRDYTALEAAADTHTPGREFAKAVVFRVGGEPAMAVVPSHHHVDWQRLSQALGGRPVELAPEGQVDALCEDCEPGAVPIFGNLYGIPVYASPELARSKHITCVAGGHEDVIRIAYRDFERLVQPEQVECSKVNRDADSGTEGFARM